MTSKITIYHNPKCGTSRKVLDLIRAAGHEPKVVEYLKAPPSRQELSALGKKAGGIRRLLREKEPLFTSLGLTDPALADERIIDAMLEHPVLINRPIVVSPKGVRLCRPPESVRDLL